MGRTTELIERQSEKSPACIGGRRGHTGKYSRSNMHDGEGIPVAAVFTYIDGVNVAFMESAHMPVREQTVWEK